MNQSNSSAGWDIAVSNISSKVNIDYTKERIYLEKTLHSKLAIEFALQRIYDAEYRKRNKRILSLKQRYRYFIKRYGKIPEEFLDDFKELIEIRKDLYELQSV